jgi:hypothetical protein
MNEVAQTPIRISSELDIIFKRHNDRKYVLAWYHGIIRTFGGKIEIANKIRSQFAEVNRRNRIALKGRYSDDNVPLLNGVTKFESGTQLFLEDFARLSHGDIERIKTMNIYEALSFPITKINNQPIEREG